MTDPKQRQFDPPVGCFKNRFSAPELVREFRQLDGRLLALVGSVTPENGLSLWCYDLFRYRSIQTCSAVHVGSRLDFHRQGKWSKTEASEVEDILARLWWELADKLGGCVYPDTLCESVPVRWAT